MNNSDEVYRRAGGPWHAAASRAVADPYKCRAFTKSVLQENYPLKKCARLSAMHHRVLGDVVQVT
jgi:hypothetical protein